jgi:hypothetical protein
MRSQSCILGSMLLPFALTKKHFDKSLHTNAAVTGIVSWEYSSMIAFPLFQH